MTTSDLPVSSPSGLPEGRFAGREAFQQMVRDAFATAACEGWAEILISDANFHDWPLGERAVVESLQAWAKGGRRFTMLAVSYDDVIRRHARFVGWRGTWDHIMTAAKAPRQTRWNCPACSGRPGGSCSDWTRCDVLAWREAKPIAECWCARF